MKAFSILGKNIDICGKNIFPTLGDFSYFPPYLGKISSLFFFPKNNIVFFFTFYGKTFFLNSELFFSFFKIGYLLTFSQMKKKCSLVYVVCFFQHRQIGLKDGFGVEIRLKTTKENKRKKQKKHTHIFLKSDRGTTKARKRRTSHLSSKKNNKRCNQILLTKDFKGNKTFITKDNQIRTCKG